MLPSTNSDLLNKAGIYEKFHKASLDSFSGPKKIISIIREYMDTTDGKGSFLVGENGVGKSYLVCAAFVELLSRGLPVYRVHAQTVHQWYLDNNREKMRLVSSAYFLCIDDFGKDHFDSPAASALSAKVWDGILRYRVERNRPTWFTSNIELKKIRQMYGDSLASLMMEAVDVLPVSGKTDRRKNGFKYHEL
jgi:DNA replication protein DnaC